MELSEQVARVAELDAEIEGLEETLATIRSERDHLINVGIPTTLDLFGVESLTLSDGTTASIEIMTNCSYIDKAKFFEYLVFSGQDVIIKQAEPTIHPQTLKAWARRAENVPEGLVEITQWRRAKIGRK